MVELGKLILITGPMWSGKTTELLRLFDRKTRASLKCLLVKHGIDNRYGENLVATHTNIEGYSNKVQALSCESISDIFTKVTVTDYNSIFIDEIQFFVDKTRCLEILKHGVDVVVAGLNGDWKQEMFPDMDKLFACASDIRLLTAICGVCKKNEACYTSKICTTNSQIDVGGADKYVPTCLYCKLKNDKLNNPNDN
jgi:thymidine kinase